MASIRKSLHVLLFLIRASSSTICGTHNHLDTLGLLPSTHYILFVRVSVCVLAHLHQVISGEEGQTNVLHQLGHVLQPGFLVVLDPGNHGLEHLEHTHTHTELLRLAGNGFLERDIGLNRYPP